MHPRLLTSLVLVDPVIMNASSAPSSDTPGSSYTRLSTFRRDKWPSRAEVAKSVKKSKFYQSWDSRVLDLWIQYGVRELPTAPYPEDPEASKKENDVPVTLTTTKHQEVFTFLRPNFNGLDVSGEQIVDRHTTPDLDLTAEDTYPFYRPEPPMIFNNLPHLRPSALFVFGGTSALSSPEWRKQKMERTGTGVGGSGGAKEGRVDEVVFEDVGHLVPMETVDKTAEAAAYWFVKELKRWREEEEQWKREWEAKGKRERSLITEQWEKKVGGDPRGKGSEKL